MPKDRVITDDCEIIASPVYYKSSRAAKAKIILRRGDVVGIGSPGKTCFANAAKANSPESKQWVEPEYLVADAWFKGKAEMHAIPLSCFILEKGRPYVTWENQDYWIVINPKAKNKHLILLNVDSKRCVHIDRTALMKICDKDVDLFHLVLTRKSGSWKRALSS